MRRTLILLSVVTLLAAIATGCCTLPCSSGEPLAWNHGTRTAWNLDAYESPCE